jgi:dTDP-4-dehydrorhamnose reductase
MTILLFGGHGWIGSQLYVLFKADCIIPPKEIRLDDLDTVRCYLDSFQTIDHIICCIGRTYGEGFNNIDYLEQKGKLRENIRDNLFGPLALAFECNQRNIHYTYLGTGCIFTEYPENGFTEKDIGNFYGSSYSTVKNYTDQLMKLVPNVLNVRFRMPITADLHPRSFLTKIIQYSRICSMPNTVSVLPILLPILKDMILKKRTGTIHLVNPEPITHNEILEMYREIVNPYHNWTNMTVEEQNIQLKSQRSNTHLSASNLLKEYPDIPTAKEAIYNIFISLTE